MTGIEGFKYIKPVTVEYVTRRLLSLTLTDIMFIRYKMFYRLLFNYQSIKSQFNNGQRYLMYQFSRLTIIITFNNI